MRKQVIQRAGRGGELAARGARSIFARRPLAAPTYLFCLFLFLSARNAYALRIVSLLPSNTEILEALGAGDQIVGVTRFDQHREGREVIGDFLQPNLEKIIFLKPDIVVAGYSASNRSVARLRQLGYRVEEIHNPKSLIELYATIVELAHVVNAPARAELVIEDMKKRVQRLEDRTRRRGRRFRTYIEIDPPYWTVGGHDFMSEVLAHAGADNIFMDLERPSAQVSPETILKRDPEVILSFNLAAQDMKRRPGWSHLMAVQRGRVLDQIDRDALARPSPRLLDAVEAVADQLDGFAAP